MTIQQSLEREKMDLQSKILLLEKSLNNAPTGQLRISHSNGSVQYYFRDLPLEKSTENIPEAIIEPEVRTENTKKETANRRYFYCKNESLARSIAQRDYDQKLLNELQSRCKAIDRTIRAYNHTAPEKIIQSFSPDRQKLIEPSITEREKYIEQWLAVDYPRKLFGENTPEIYTMKGERVRSKSEKIIADTLFRYDIPYRYEFPLKLSGYGLVHPDFMVLNSFTRKEYFYEHFGMMDNEQYIKDALKKIEAYEKNDFFPGQELIITSETRAMPLNIRILEKIIHRYFL